MGEKGLRVADIAAAHFHLEWAGEFLSDLKIYERGLAETLADEMSKFPLPEEVERATSQEPKLIPCKFSLAMRFPLLLDSICDHLLKALECLDLPADLEVAQQLSKLRQSGPKKRLAVTARGTVTYLHIDMQGAKILLEAPMRPLLDIAFEDSVAVVKRLENFHAKVGEIILTQAGGAARAESLTPKRRAEIAKKAAAARWGKKKGSTGST